MIHGKKESILQWYNSLTTKGDVHSLTQFTDGSHFYDIVASLDVTYLVKQKDASNTAASLADSAKPVDVKQIDNIMEEADTEKSVPQSTAFDAPEMAENGGIDSQKKYDAVMEFINSLFKLDSTSLINYPDCMKGNELELAKVAVFLLSALVQNLISAENQFIYTITLLDNQVQEDIKECLSLVLTDRSQSEGPLKKSEVHKILNRSAVCKGSSRGRHQSRSSGSTDHNEASEGGKRASKMRKEKSSNIVSEDLQDSPLKTFLESPNIQYKAVILRKESELLKLKKALHLEENKVVDLVAEKNTLSEELENKKKEAESLKKEFGKFREEEAEFKFSKLKEIQNLKESTQSLEKENNKLKEVNETLNNKVEEMEIKLAEQTIPDCDQHVNFAEMSFKDDKIALLEAEVMRLEKKLHTLELPNQRNVYSSSPEDQEIIKSIANGNNVIEALFYKKEREKTLLMKELLEEHDKIKMWKLLYKTARKEKQELVNEITKNMAELSAKDSNLLSYQNQLDAFRRNCTCQKNVKTNYNRDKGQKRFDDSTNSEQFHSETISESTLAEVLLENNVNDSVSREKKTFPEFHSFMLLAEADFAILKIMIQELVELIESKNYVLDSQALVKLGDELNHVKCIKQILLAVGSIINILKLAKPNISATNRRSRSDVDPQIQALIHEETELKKENESLTLELMNVKKKFQFQLEMKEAELQVAVKQCETLEASEKELNATIDQVRKEAEENYKKFELTKNFLEMKKIQYNELVKKEISSIFAFGNAPKDPCGECEKLKQKIRELQRECDDWEQENRELKATAENHHGRMQNLDHRVRQLEHDKEELEFKLRSEVAFLSGTLSDREAVMLQYYNKAMAEFKAKVKALKKTNKMQQGLIMHTASTSAHAMSRKKNSCIHENSVSISNQSVEDEEDSLNYSSLADIDSESMSEYSNADDHLKEPLEIGNRTSTESDYEAQQEPVNENFVSEGERRYYRKQKAQYFGNDDDNSDSEESFISNKRKAIENNSTNASKKIRCLSSMSSGRYARMRSTTSVQGKPNLLKKGSIRTSTIRRYVSVPCNNVKK